MCFSLDVISSCKRLQQHFFFQMQNILFPFMMKLLTLFMRKSVLHLYFSAHLYAVNTF